MFAQATVNNGKQSKENGRQPLKEIGRMVFKKSFDPLKKEHSKIFHMASNR